MRTIQALIVTVQEWRSVVASLYGTWCEIQAAPPQLREVGVQLGALAACLESLCIQLSSEDSILRTHGSSEIPAIERLVEKSIRNIQLIQGTTSQYTESLLSGQTTWKKTFENHIAALRWTQENGKVQDLIAQLKEDIGLINNVIEAIRNKALSSLQQTLRILTEDTAHIRQKTDFLERMITQIHRVVVGGNIAALNEAFDSDDDFAASNSEDSNTAIYDSESSIISQDREYLSEKSQVLDSQIIPHVGSETPVTTAEFLWRLARQAAKEKPWDGKLRSSDRYEGGSCEFVLWNFMSHLMTLTEYGRKWDTTSISSWLTAGAWYLAKARYKLAGEIGKYRGASVETLADFIKAYWIVLTIDQHPQKPLASEAGRFYREYEQFQNLSNALFSEIHKADKILNKEKLGTIADILEKNLGQIWEKSSGLDNVVDDHIIAAFASQILENARPAQSYIEPDQKSMSAKRGQWEPLCPNSWITLPRKYHHIPKQPTVLACACEDFRHLKKLKAYYVTKDSKSSIRNDTHLVIDEIRELGNSDTRTRLAFVCASIEDLNQLREQLQDVVLRLAALGEHEISWPATSFKSPSLKALRLTRSPFDNALPGARFTKALNSMPQDELRQPTPTQEVMPKSPTNEKVENSVSIWSRLWGIFSPENTGAIKRTQINEGERLESHSAPVQKDPDYTETCVISPLVLTLRQRINGTSTLHLISTTSRFELCVTVGKKLRWERISYNGVRLFITPDTVGVDSSNSTIIDVALEGPHALERMYRYLVFASTFQHTQCPLNEVISNRGRILWEGPLGPGLTLPTTEFCPNSELSLILVSSSPGQKMSGVVFETKTMKRVLVFQHQGDSIVNDFVLPDLTVDAFWIPVTGIYIYNYDQADETVDRNSDMSNGPQTARGDFEALDSNRLRLIFQTEKAASKAKAFFSKRNITAEFRPIKTRCIPTKLFSLFDKPMPQIYPSSTVLQVERTTSKTFVHLWFKQASAQNWSDILSPTFTVQVEKAAKRCKLSDTILSLRASEMKAKDKGKTQTGKGDFEFQFESKKDAEKLYQVLLEKE